MMQKDEQLLQSQNKFYEVSLENKDLTIKLREQASEIQHLKAEVEKLKEVPFCGNLVDLLDPAESTISGKHVQIIY